MAKLHSTMENSKGNVVSCTNSKVARTMAETWDVRITTVLTAEGEYTIHIEDRQTGKILKVVDGCYPPKK